MNIIALKDLNTLVKSEKIIIPIADNFNYECFIYFKIKKTKLYLYIISKHNNINMVPYISKIINYIAVHTKTNKKNISHVISENNCHVLKFNTSKYIKLNFTDYLVNNKPIKSNHISIKCYSDNIDKNILIKTIEENNIRDIFVNNKLIDYNTFYGYIIHYVYYTKFIFTDLTLCLRDINDE